MKLLLSKSTTVWGIGVAIALLFVGLLFGIIYTKTTSASQDEGRLITIYDRGDEEVFLSDAATIADALKDAEVSLDSHDVVEPGLDQHLSRSSSNDCRRCTASKGNDRLSNTRADY